MRMKALPILLPLALLGAGAPTISFDEHAVDRSVDPCTDFYQYACNAWIKSNPIPADQPAWGRMNELALRNQNELRDILEKAEKDARDPVQRKIGDYYAACMDERAIEQKGTRPLQDELHRIAALKSKAELPALLAHLHLVTFLAGHPTDSGSHTPLFGFTSGQDLSDASKVVATADQGGLGLPDRDYYLKDDKKSVELRAAYGEHVARMLGLLGEPAAQAQKDAKTVLDIETALANASMDIVMRRDPANLNHRMSQAELAALTPDFAWGPYFKGLDEAAIRRTPHFLVNTPDFFRGLDAQIKQRPLAEWQTYLRWHLVHDASAMLPDAFVKESFAFYGKALRGAKELRPRWKRCVAAADMDLGEAVGQAYVERTFGPEGKARMMRLVSALGQALRSDISTLAWMSPATRKAAEEKLKAIENKIGYPEHWRDYGSLGVRRDDALGNSFRAGEFELRRQLAKIGKPVDRGEWLMTPATVNAYYDSQLNTINFPAGILQPPLFDKTQDDAVNLGAIGSVIGHEMTHGFDDEGRKYDGQGNLRDWWTAQDGKEFERRAQCIADQYSGYVATGDTKINGKLTLGENTADSGGLRVALMAMHDLEGKKAAKKDAAGFTADQRFFLAYGQAWCSNMTPEFLRWLALSNPHSPANYRVNGVLSNMPEFARAFQCKAGQPMVRKDPCRVW